MASSFHDESSSHFKDKRVQGEKFQYLNGPLKFFSCPSQLEISMELEFFRTV